MVVYEMLTGRVAFQADTPAAVLLSHLNKAMPPTPELAGELSRHAEEVLRKALAKAPSDRFRRAGDFVAALTPAAWPTRGRPAGNGATSDATPRRKGSRRLPSVLVVDDGAGNRELIQACLARVDCQVMPAERCPSALEAIE